MTTSTFDHEASVLAVRDYFDTLGDGEWERLAADLPGQVSYEVHRQFLRRFVRPGMHVLEIGAGPGRFTVDLARSGARVTVADISSVQLDLNARHVAAAGVDEAVVDRQVRDICDLGDIPDGTFDAVVAYGGPLSYAFDRAETAMCGLVRVTRAGGPVVASVMSTLGAYRHFLGSVAELVTTHGLPIHDRILATGDLREIQPPGSGQHTCRMFRFADVRALVTAADATLIAASASNWASLGDPVALQRLAEDPQRWRWFLRREVEMCAEPGALDGGTHLLFAAMSRRDRQ